MDLNGLEVMGVRKNMGKNRKASLLLVPVSVRIKGGQRGKDVDVADQVEGGGW